MVLRHYVHTEHLLNARPRMKPMSVEKHKCPECSRETNCEVFAHIHDNDDHGSDGEFVTYSEHFMLKCRGCDRVFHEIKSIFSEDIHQIGYDAAGDPIYLDNFDYKYWPNVSRRSLPSWINDVEDVKINNALREVYRSLQVNIPRLTAVGLRLVIDLVFEHLGIDGELTFKDKVKEFRKVPSVGTQFADEVSHMIEAGGAAIHRGWKPTTREIDTLFDGLEDFLKAQFSPREAVQVVKVPARK